MFFNGVISNMFTDDRAMMVLCALLPAVLFSAVYSAFRGSLWGTKNYFFVSMAELVEQVVRIVAFVILGELIFPDSNGEFWAGISMSVGCFFSMLFVLIVYFVNKRKLAQPKGFYKEVWKVLCQ